MMAQACAVAFEKGDSFGSQRSNIHTSPHFEPPVKKGVGPGCGSNMLIVVVVVWGRVADLLC